MPFPSHDTGGIGTGNPDHQSKHSDAPNTASDWLHSYLKKQMTLSKRRGGWFQLEKRERSMFSLALRLTPTFKGFQLLKAMVAVLKKLMEASSEAYGRLLHGISLAWDISTKCVEWGNSAAKGWRNDLEYARYLGSQMGGGSRW